MKSSFGWDGERRGSGRQLCCLEGDWMTLGVVFLVILIGVLYSIYKKAKG